MTYTYYLIQAASRYWGEYRTGEGDGWTPWRSKAKEFPSLKEAREVYETRRNTNPNNIPMHIVRVTERHERVDV